MPMERARYGLEPTVPHVVFTIVLPRRCTTQPGGGVAKMPCVAAWEWAARVRTQNIDL